MEDFLGIVLSVSFSIAYVPQIFKMIKRKKSEDVSFIMLLINAVGYYCGLGYILMKELNAYWLTFNYTSGLIMTALCIIVWSYYSKRILLGELKNWISKKLKK